MGFVRKRPSRTRGTRYQAVAVLGGARVQLGTFGSFSLATDAWQHAETTARPPTRQRPARRSAAVH
jgi:hypothetical protein